MLQYMLIFLAGLAGSVHCIGMCGGFACAMGRDPRGPAATLRRHLIYNVGRATTYCFLGAGVGYLGVLIVGHGGEASAVSLAQRLLAGVSGLLMMYIGLQFFGCFRGSGRHLAGAGGEFLAAALRQLLKSPGAGAPLAVGVLNGFLPCPLVYAFAAQAAGSGGPLPGLLTMAAFSLGTFPAMLLMGGVSIWLRPRFDHIGTPAVQPVRTDRLQSGGTLARPSWRLQTLRVAGGFIVLLGVITFARGILPMSAHMHGL
jgi:sulfite exporter TauE/SafE